MKTIMIAIVFALAVAVGLVLASESDSSAGMGCCSYHGGECGCNYATRRVECCDGTLSPSCKC